MLEQLLTMANGMNNRFPNGNKPYEIMTRLLEECGEIASEVNRLEDSGTKVLRHGEEEVEQSVERAIRRLTDEGCIVQGGNAHE